MKKQTFPANAGKPWDEKQDEQLRELFARGKSFEDIAHAMRRTGAGIQARADRLGYLAHLPLCDPQSGCEHCQAHRLRIAAYKHTLIAVQPSQHAIGVALTEALADAKAK
jgi:hypothetical protein